MTFDVTIPVLNEEATLAENVGILHDFLKSNFPSPNQWRIVIADNGSEDQTPVIGKQLDTQWEGGTIFASSEAWGRPGLEDIMGPISEADIVGYMDLRSRY